MFVYLDSSDPVESPSFSPVHLTRSHPFSNHSPSLSHSLGFNRSIHDLNLGSSSRLIQRDIRGNSKSTFWEIRGTSKLLRSNELLEVHRSSSGSDGGLWWDTDPQGVEGAVEEDAVLSVIDLGWLDDFGWEWEEGGESGGFLYICGCRSGAELRCSWKFADLGCIWLLCEDQ